MKTREFYLQTLCFNEGKHEFIPYVERYCNMSAEEIEEEYYRIISDKFLETDFDKPSIVTKIKSFLNRLKNKKEINWRNAFLYFYADSNQQSECIFERMGLPVSGIRTDRCPPKF